MIDNILDLATVDAGIAQLQPEHQEVALLVDKARAGLAATFPDIDGEPSLNLKVVIEPDLPPFIADGTRIVTVLYNLLSIVIELPVSQLTSGGTAKLGLWGTISR